MADDVTLPGTGAVVATDDVGGRHYQRVKLDKGEDGVSSPITDDNPLPTGIRAPNVAFWPGYGAPEAGLSDAGIDPSGGLSTRSAVLTDEGTYRANFANTSLAVAIGTVTVSGATVTGTGFTASAAHLRDYFKLDADGESNWTQISSIDSDTQLTLVNTYPGGASGAASRALVKPTTGAGGSVTVANGACTLAMGTTIGAVTSIVRDVDYAPLVNRARVSVSQRIANNTILVGLQDKSSTVKYFARFRLDGTVNTTVVCESGHNPTLAPSAAETETTTVTIPNATSAVGVDYRVEVMTESVNFFVNDRLVARHARCMPSPFDILTAGVWCTNGGTAPATSTSVVVDFLTSKNHNKVEVGVMSDAERIIAAQPPMEGVTYTQAGVIAINTDLMVIDCSQFRSLSIQATSIGTTGVVTPAWSNDGVNYFAASIMTTAGVAAGTFNAAGLWTTNVYARFFRLRLTTATTAGTTTLNVQGMQFPVSQPVVQPISGSVTASGTVTANQGTLVTPTALNHNSAAAVSLVSIKTSAGTLYNVSASNNGAGAAFLKLYNKASAPVVASDVPILILPIAASGAIDHDFGLIGHRFTTGIAMAITGAMADTDATVLAAGQVKAIASYI
jgi:hypothetical protein